jgi:hypothetical protein
MEKKWFIAVIFALVVIAVIIWVIKKNYKDRKNLFKKLPGDPPDPKYVKSEFDTDDK